MVLLKFGSLVITARRVDWQESKTAMDLGKHTPPSKNITGSLFPPIQKYYRQPFLFVELILFGLKNR